MKNQLDLIISIVSLVLAVIGGIVLFATKPEPVAPAAAPTVTLTAVGLPDPATLVTYTNGLPGGSGTAAGSPFGGGAAGSGGAFAGLAGAGGPGGRGRAGAGRMGG
jgi:hypothetical protein